MEEKTRAATRPKVIRTTHHSAVKSGSKPRLISVRARWLKTNPISTNTARRIFTIADILIFIGKADE